MSIILDTAQAPAQDWYVEMDAAGNVVSFGYGEQPPGDPRRWRRYGSEAELVFAYPTLFANIDAEQEAPPYEVHDEEFGADSLDDVYRVKREEAARIVAAYQAAGGNPDEATIDAPLLKQEAVLRGLALDEMAEAVIDEARLDPLTIERELARVASKIALPKLLDIAARGTLREDDELDVDFLADPRVDGDFALIAFNEANTVFAPQPFNEAVVAFALQAFNEI